MGLVGDADFGSEPPAAAVPIGLVEGPERECRAALRAAVGEPRHRAAHDLPADQLNPLIWGQEQVVEGLELQGLHVSPRTMDR